jgi:ubiquinone/menaquinone biosynthesis C-methylase UbiE
MSSQDYEYRGLMASLWDFFRGDTSTWSDRFFYREPIQRYGQPVLDVGCGTGRLLLDFMADGVDIDGVDNSPEMLDLCRQKAQQLGLEPRLFQQVMEALDLPRHYQTILVPSSSFQLVLEPQAAAEAMRRFVAHLQPGGVLIMPFMIIWKEGDPIETEWSLREKVRPEDGAVARRWSRVRFEVENQLEHTEDRYEISLEGNILASEHHQRSPATRWYTQEQARHLYQEAGLTDIQMFSNFTFEPAKEDDAIFCVVGRKPQV